jgi:hypothetical protein
LSIILGYYLPGFIKQVRVWAPAEGWNMDPDHPDLSI